VTEIYQGVSVMVAAMSRSHDGAPPPSAISHVALYGSETVIESPERDPAARSPPTTFLQPPGMNRGTKSIVT
jgi:hypothetical protein